MIAWLDALSPYARGGLCGSRRVDADDEDTCERGACMRCGVWDELSFYLCWACIKKMNGREKK